MDAFLRASVGRTFREGDFSVLLRSEFDVFAFEWMRRSGLAHRAARIFVNAEFILRLRFKSALAPIHVPR
jgi:hypothetical protein